ncbi:MAG: two-component system, response regulator PdtaR [Sphingomonadales bacterium]|jgi:CheY-like chemotaxis protein|nr:two-component system, response regulator PdtaR [Sphingomonadales bacterium]
MALRRAPGQLRRIRQVGEGRLLNILIVEDEPLLADTLRRLVELNPRFRVTAIAEDTASAVAAVDEQRPDLALVDLQLANATSGFSVAAKLHERGVACLFTTARVPTFPLPDLAIGCLQKPFREEHLVRALAEAEDILKGRPKVVLRRRLPEELQLYSEAEVEPAPAWLPAVRRRTSLAARLWKLVRRPSSFRSAAA